MGTVNKSLYNSPSKTTRDVFVSISIIRGVWMLVQEGKVFSMDFSRHVNYCHIFSSVRYLSGFSECLNPTSVPALPL